MCLCWLNEYMVSDWRLKSRNKGRNNMCTVRAGVTTEHLRRGGSAAASLPQGDAHRTLIRPAGHGLTEVLAQTIRLKTA